MSEAKHTPGPWEWRIDDGMKRLAPGVIILDDDGGGPWGDEIDRANAALIAAAPDGYALAQFIKAHAVQEELSTHVAVSFDEADAVRLLHMAERFLSKCCTPQARTERVTDTGEQP